MPRTPKTAKTPKAANKTKISPIGKGQKSITAFTVSKAVEKVQDSEFFPNEDEVMELEIIPEKKIRVSRDQVEEKFSLGNLQLQFGRKLEYLEDEIKQKPEIVTNVELCKAIENGFGIKKLFSRALSDNRPWKEKIKIVNGKYTCIKCGKSYGTELGCKYHVEGKCPKDLAIYVCRLCGFSAKEQGLMELHIRKEHMGETEAKAPTRGPSAAPNSWFISEELIGRASQIEKHRNLKFGQMDQIEYPIELPDYNNNSRGLFTGSFTSRRLLSGTKPNSFYLKTHESETLVKNQQFILNAGSKITDIAWIKVGECDGFCLSTTSDFYGCNVPTQPRSISSSIQFWKFNQSLTDDKIESAPILFLSKNCPFRINSICQINAQKETFIAAACSDGHVRLIRIGSRCSGDIQIDLNNFILLESPTSNGLPTSALAIDSFGESVVVGYNSGLINLYELSDTIDIKKIIPTRTIRAHTKPVTCVQFNPENSNIFASSGYDRETKIFNFKNGETVFSSESFPAHLVYDISWMTNSLILATESFFCDHTGLVHFDPAYQETKFRLLEASASSVMAVSYNYLTGTLAYADIDGKIILSSLQNPRRVLGMSRKGYQAVTLTDARVTEKQSANGKGDFNVGFIDHPDLEKINKIDKKNSKYSKPSYSIELETNCGSGWTCMKWNHSFGSRSTWLIAGSNSGLVRIFDVSGLRQIDQRGEVLSRKEFQNFCLNLNCKKLI